MIIKVEHEIDLSDMEEWCGAKFTASEIEDIKEYLNDVMTILYPLRDWINDAIINERE